MIERLVRAALCLAVLASTLAVTAGCTGRGTGIGGPAGEVRTGETPGSVPSETVPPEPTGAGTATATGETTPGATTEATPTGSATDTKGVWTPPKGSPERQAMMNAMRAYLGRQDLIFVVNFLKAKGGWAFAQVSPETKDGGQKLEGLDFLLKGAGSAWGVKAAMGLNGEDDWLKYESAGSVRKYWAGAFPSAPGAIFPNE